MKYITIALLIAFSTIMATAPILPQSAHAQATIQLRPVMIIRFNKPRVSFQKQLSMVIRRAKQIKPNVIFDVIQYTPDTQSRSRLAQYSRNQQKVVRSMLSAGVSQSQLNMMHETTPDVTTDEVYIFVR